MHPGGGHSVHTASRSLLRAGGGQRWKGGEHWLQVFTLQCRHKLEKVYMFSKHVLANVWKRSKWEPGVENFVLKCPDGLIWILGEKSSLSDDERNRLCHAPSNVTADDSGKGQRSRSLHSVGVRRTWFECFISDRITASWMAAQTSNGDSSGLDTDSCDFSLSHKS